MADANAWIGLVEETREALANLRTEELERLVIRAQQALAVAAKTIPRSKNLRELAARHRVLGEVLQATEQNLAVLRRLHSREREGDARWVR